MRVLDRMCAEASDKATGSCVLSQEDVAGGCNARVGASASTDVDACESGRVCL